MMKLSVCYVQKHFQIDTYNLNTNIRHTHGQKRIRKKDVLHYECDICEKILSSPQTLKAHISGFHDRLKQHTCTICGEQFVRKGDINRHVKKNHQNIKSHNCDRCEESFNDLLQLQNHVAKFHDKIKSLECEICNKTFYMQRNLKRHLKIHDESSKKNCINVIFVKRCSKMNII